MLRRFPFCNGVIVKFLDQVTEHTFFCCKLLTQLKIQIEIYRFLENKNKAFLEFFLFCFFKTPSDLSLHWSYTRKGKAVA